MKLKFNKFERIAGAFVLSVVIGSVMVVASLAIHKGWFEQTLIFRTELQSAEGIWPGTAVHISGIRAGQVEVLDLKAHQKIDVTLKIKAKYQHLLREDSQVFVERSFVIGEKFLDITVGSQDSQILKEGSTIAHIKTVDILEMVSARRLGNGLQALSGVIDNLEKVLVAFSDPERSQAVIQTFDNLAPLTKNLNELSVQLIDGQNVGTLVKNLAKTTTELNSLLPVIKQHSPEMASNLKSIVKDMAVMTEQFVKLAPAIDQLSGQLPESGKRAIEAIDQATVVLKAMQKTFLLRSAAEEVKKEELKRPERLPAQESTP